MNDNDQFLYIYGTGYRSDGFHFAVGDAPGHGEAPNGCRALFQNAQDAHTFAYAEQARTDCLVHVLASAKL